MFVFVPDQYKDVSNVMNQLHIVVPETLYDTINTTIITW